MVVRGVVMVWWLGMLDGMVVMVWMCMVVRGVVMVWWCWMV